MNLNKELQKALRNNKYEMTDTGILFPEQKVGAQGVFNHWLGTNGPNDPDADFQVDPNRVVNEGLNYLLDSALSGGTLFTSWYIAPYKNNYTPLAGDTGATFPGAGKGNEATTEYDETARPTWIDAGAASQNITNSASPAVFTFNTTVSIYGAFMVSGSVKGSTSNTLLAASLFSSVRNLVSTDVLNVTYSLSIADV